MDPVIYQVRYESSFRGPYTYEDAQKLASRLPGATIEPQKFVIRSFLVMYGTDVDNWEEYYEVEAAKQEAHDLGLSDVSILEILGGEPVLYARVPGQKKYKGPFRSLREAMSSNLWEDTPLTRFDLID